MGAVSGPAFADSAADKQRAAELAAQSADHYKRGEFEVSAALLRQAYALYPEPNLLYNLGRSLESVGDAKGAVEAFRKYLDTNAKIDDRGAIERRIKTLEAEIAERERREQTDKRPEPPPPPPQPVPKISQPAERPPEPGLSPLPWIVIGGGVALIGGGALFGVQASDRHDQAVTEPTGLEAQRLQDSAKSRATLANVLFIAGGAAVIGGVIWEIRDRKHRRDTVVRASGSAIQLEVTW
jgi:tetratricopeptide (TPR) repeat protein